MKSFGKSSTEAINLFINFSVAGKLAGKFLSSRIIVAHEGIEIDKTERFFMLPRNCLQAIIFVLMRLFHVTDSNYV